MMRNMIAKIKRIFVENIWLKGIMVAVLIAVGILMGWKLNETIEKESEDIEVVSSEEERKFTYLTVKIHKNQAYLVNEDEEVFFGPCLYIYDSNGLFTYSSIFRYIDNNGLIGYGKIGKTEVTVLYPGTFSEASEMSNGSALVKEGDDIYYIDKEGKRFTNGKYKNAFPFEESQGIWARVQKMDGSWSIIDSEENEVLTGFDYITELPYMTEIGAGVKNGKVVLFSLSSGKKPVIKKEYEEYCEINVKYRDFMVITSKEGKKGVIAIWNGKIMVPAEYIDIEWEKSNAKVRGEKYENYFRCRKEDGTYDVIYWKE